MLFRSENVFARRTASAVWPASKALRTASICRAGSVMAAAARCPSKPCAGSDAAITAACAHRCIAKTPAANAILAARRISSPPQRSSLELKKIRNRSFFAGRNAIPDGMGPMGRVPRNLPRSILLEFGIPCHAVPMRRKVRAERRPPFARACRDGHPQW